MLSMCYRLNYISNRKNPLVRPYVLVKPVLYITKEAPDNAYFDALLGKEIRVLIVIELL
jgi:hypothetical protein